MTKRRVKRHPVTQPDDPSYRLIPLTQNQNCMVDAADYEWLSQWNWCAKWCPSTRSFRAERGSTKEGSVIMARVILGCRPNEEADHANHDTLDNRRRNLRKATVGLSRANRKTWSRSGYKGVSWFKRKQKWMVVIQVNKRRILVGYFSDREQAARAYDAAAREHFGGFACTNFPD